MVKVAVVGCGLLGTKIAGELAYHGHKVKVTDSKVENLNKVYEKLQEDKKMLKDDGILTHDNFIGQVLCMSRLEETVKDVDFVFECIIDDLEIKKDLFQRISHLCRPDTVIATNTLRLDVSEISSRTYLPERTIGLRFLFPVYYIPEVEVRSGKDTSHHTIEKTRKFLEKMGKTLFFRSGIHPLILTEEQREERKKNRIAQIKEMNNSGHQCVLLPLLSHSGNIKPKQDDEDSIVPSDMDRDCAICMDRIRDCVLRPCNHMVTCSQCAKMLFNRRDGCPICRKDITDTISVYHS
ncbi:3-hydroxybutyryl-CoA dehydrogenase [Patella vulgata]|uniref:3-hydroxybutyryl-CoA dehydrogenase n=1 Tax=Patella vulgata TaxID=6465 RepID=UPI00217FED89|nr:3-hydroxybutyryl-CoA dehydrogenase [Patella vulgata]